MFTNLLMGFHLKPIAFHQVGAVIIALLHVLQQCMCCSIVHGILPALDQ